jgi:hypothetical protein
VRAPCVPVPLSAIVSGEPGALLVIETLPLALMAVVGVNLAVKEVLAPALIVSGTVSPLIVKPVPDALAAVIVTLAVPEFVSVTDCDALLPSATLPKLTLVGFGVRAPCAPVPLRAIVSGEPGALLVIETLPLALPAVVGVNLEVKEVLAPALIVSGTVKPLIVKPVPDALAAVIVTLPVPEFVRVMD